MIQPSIFPDSIICAYSNNEYGEVAPFREKGDGLQDELSEATIKNREQFLTDNHLTREKIVELKQFHTDKVIFVSKKDFGAGYIDEADGMITNEKGVALSVFTSDCLPVFFYDPAHKIIAIAHAGWRGVYSNIIPKTVQQISLRFQSDPQNILVWIGPHVSGDSYCFENNHYNDSPANEYFDSMGGIKQGQDTFCVDLGLIAHKQLTDSGIAPDHIETSKLDTKTDNRLFSYQAGDRTNNMGVIMMK